MQRAQQLVRQTEGHPILRLSKLTSPNPHSNLRSVFWRPRRALGEEISDEPTCARGGGPSAFCAAAVGELQARGARCFGISH
eukprot:8347965-Pyramimonas_sp.AAC.1